MSDRLQELAEDICRTGRMLYERGFLAATEGNISCRLDTNRVLCTPTTVGTGHVRPDQTCLVDMNGNRIGGYRGPTSEILLHLALYWLGFGLFADGVRRSGFPRLAWAVLLAGAFPPFLYVNAQVVKDVGMAVAWLAAVGLLYVHRAQQRRLSVAVGVAVAALLFYGAMVRTNALFGLGPLLLYALALLERDGVLMLISWGAGLDAIYVFGAVSGNLAAMLWAWVAGLG